MLASRLIGRGRTDALIDRQTNEKQSPNDDKNRYPFHRSPDALMMPNMLLHLPLKKS
jgi:hypothetical protein